ncbi:MAG: PQQ-dependent sugar dehydrogenase [Candidatus Binatia bacterium]
MRSLPLALAALLVAAPAGACSGDCDDDQIVAVHELVEAVGLAVNGSDVRPCPAADADGDGRIDIADLVSAVNMALLGCGAATPVPSPTPGHLPECGDGAVQQLEECDDGNRLDGDGCSADCALEPGGDVCRGVTAFPDSAAIAALVTDQVERPVHVSAPPLDPRRVFVVEQEGRIRVVKDGVLLGEPFLDIQPLVSCCGERGLLSVAFHPDYERNGWFFVDYTDGAGDTVVARYTVSADADRADPNSARVLLSIDQPAPNHNGGQLAFAPDGTLFIGMGDGGGGASANGQNDGTLLGKLLRLDVDVENAPFYAVPPDNPAAARGDPLGLIWAKGFRNPWRLSFDRLTGDLYIGDVGEGRAEEIDVAPNASRGGENYGWNIFEGLLCFQPPGGMCPDQRPPVFTPPVFTYGRREGCSVTGGFVYRGCALPGLRGAYFFSDYCSALLRTFRLEGGVVTDLADRTAALAPGGGREIEMVVSFGEDARGELYIADLGGEVYKLVPAR